MAKLQITLTPEETELLRDEAATVGYSVTKYAKFLLGQRAAFIAHRKGEPDPSQAWFWAEEWQQGEQEADADIREGRVFRLESVEDLDRSYDELFPKRR